MKTYHKINTIFKRDMTKPKNPIIIGNWSEPEFEYLQNNIWVGTEKVDGTNMRIMFDGNTITFGGKTDNAQIPTPLLNNLNQQFLPLLDLFKSEFLPNEEGQQPMVCFYGEGYGKGIQKGGVYSDTQQFVLFDININGWWLTRDSICNIAKKFNIDVVPQVFEGTLHDAIFLVGGGMTSTWGKFESEGLILKPKVDLSTRGFKRIITKIKTVDFRV